MTCCSESGLLPVNLAIKKLIDSLAGRPALDTETLPIQNALGRVLAAPISSTVNVPPHDNSAMDGYALRYEDLNSTQELAISQRIPAGVAPEPLKPGSAARIFTGAPVPEGADTVVMQEDTEQKGDDTVVFKGSVKPGAHIRKAGEDIQLGQTVLSPGHVLKAQDLGLIASVGVPEVRVYRPLKVALLFSGDELLEPGDAPEPGKIYNSNRYMLAPLMQQLGFEIGYQANIPDTFDETLAALKLAAQKADVVVTTGGVSVGEEDHLKPAVEALGSLDLWKVNIKPGKPFAFGSVTVNGAATPFIGLPGNPVSVFSTLLILGLPYLRSLQGETWQPPVPLTAPICFANKKAGKRDEYLRVKAVMREGITYLEKYPNQSSGVLSSAAWCDGFALIKAGDIYQEGDCVPFYWLSQLIGR